MQQKFKFLIPRRDSEITIILGTNILEKLGSLIDLQSFSSFLIIGDGQVLSAVQILEKCLRVTGKKTDILVLRGGEKVKSLNNLKRIYQKLFVSNADRKTLVISVGGGTVGDIVGFAGATYLRGLELIQIPTTLLAQVDASIGGKTAINFNRMKNLIGTFHQPKAVLIDFDFLKTLPEKEIKNGLAEIIKYGLILDKHLINKLTEYPKNSDILPEIIKQTVFLKMKIVCRDEQDTSHRAILNFGHTIGHAIEAISNYSHGEAVAIGMVGATIISQRMNFIGTEDVRRVLDFINDFQLPVKAEGITPAKLFKAILKDKKNEDGEIRWVLLEKIGKGMIKQKVDKKVIKQVLEKLCN